MKRKIHVWHLSVIGYLFGFIATILTYKKDLFEFSDFGWLLVGPLFGWSIGLYFFFMRKVSLLNVIKFTFVCLGSYAVIYLVFHEILSSIFVVFLGYFAYALFLGAGVLSTMPIVAAFSKYIYRLSTTQQNVFHTLGGLTILAFLVKFPLWDSFSYPSSAPNTLSFFLVWGTLIASKFGWEVLRKEKTKKSIMEHERGVAIGVVFVLFGLGLVAGVVRQGFHIAYVNEEKQEMHNLAQAMPAFFKRVNEYNYNAHPIGADFKTSNRNVDDLENQMKVFVTKHGYIVDKEYTALRAVPDPHPIYEKRFGAHHSQKGYILEVGVKNYFSATSSAWMIIDHGVDIEDPYDP